MNGWHRLLRWWRRNRLTEAQAAQMSRTIALAEMELERIDREYQDLMYTARVQHDRQVAQLSMQVTQLMDPIVRAKMLEPAPPIYLCHDCPNKPQ